MAVPKNLGLTTMKRNQKNNKIMIVKSIEK